MWPKGPGDAGRRTELAEKIVNTLGMKLVLVKPGRFQMGCPQGENGGVDEKPQHGVEITQPFYLGIHEVTQEQYEKVTNKTPSWFSSTGAGKDKVQGLDTRHFPVETVSVAEAEEFCRLLSQRERDQGREYRLPTEAEWEYACRGGHKYERSAPFYFREPTFSLDATQANFNGKSPFGGAKEGEYRGRTVSVGSFEPNALGLFDMHGNVWEWCADDRRTYQKDDIKDPVGSKNGNSRFLRGGSWVNNGSNCRAAYRYHNDVGLRDCNSGFRVCVSARTH